LKSSISKNFVMKTSKYFGFVLAAIVGGLIALFIFSKFISKPQIVYNYPYVQPKLASFSGTQQPNVDLTFAAEQTVHGVVHVRTKSKNDMTFSNPILEFLYGDGPVHQDPVLGFGSGVIVSQDGYIVTNHHVVKGADEIMVKLNDNREYDAKLVGDDPNTDIALLKIDAQNLPFIPFGNSDDLKLGEWVLAVGNPFNLTSTVTAGIVSAKARNLNIINENYKLESFIQTDAALNPGNSGGALVNVKGELVGINTAIISPTGGYAGNSFAVPVTIVKKVVDDLREFGAVQRAFIGISPTDVNAEIAKQNNLPVTTGVFIADVKESGAAKEAGIVKGDVIIKLNDILISNTSQMQEQLSKYRPKDQINVTILRDGKEKIFNLILRNLQGQTSLVKAMDGSSIMGAKIIETTTEERQKLGIRYGVKISELGAGRFSKAGIEEGFIITRMNNKPVSSISELKNILDNTRGGVYIEGIYPNGVIAYYAFGL
jgi:serine protease Do